MGIVNVREDTVPEPKGGAQMTGEKDPIQEIEDGYYRGEKLKAFKQGAGIGGEQSVQASEKTSVDIGAIIKSQNDLIANVLSQTIEARNASQGAKDNPYLQHLETELQEMRTRLNAPGQDPMEAMIQSTTRLQAFTQLMKDHLGISSGVQVAPSDMPRLIEMERLKQEGEERHHQWDTEMAERRRQWDKEDRRWMEEFRLKRLEFAESRQTKDKAAGALEDLASALIEGIDQERAEGEVVAGSGQARKPKAFKCSDCGAVVKVASPEATDAMCEGCGAWYDFMEKSESETTPAPAKV